MQLERFDAGAFLRDYWQQQPLLLRNPWREWHNPLTPDELAGLACEADIESRLVLHTPQKNRWKLEHGPFAETRFSKLSASHWTLLVQAVDQWVPEVAALLAPFRFIPDWRIDDVMVSYAADQGGVGPHFDQYDVFLIQGLGRRRWQLGGHCDHNTPLQPNQELRLLQQFTPQQEWILEPGDILYVPPRYAHNGIALGEDCMTYSVGFRAPSRADLIGHWCDHVLAQLDDDDRYADPALTPAANPGAIDPAALQRLQQLALEKLGDAEAFQRWFGGYVSTRKYPDLEERPAYEIDGPGLEQRMQRGTALLKNPASRLAFIRRADDVLLFADGEEFSCPATLAERLCAHSRFDATLPELAHCATLLAALHNQGTLVFEDGY
jgi:50S ribosomal protein L16 3-hydroxylase